MPPERGMGRIGGHPVGDGDAAEADDVVGRGVGVGLQHHRQLQTPARGRGGTRRGRRRGGGDWEKRKGGFHSRSDISIASGRERTKKSNVTQTDEFGIGPSGVPYTGRWGGVGRRPPFVDVEADEGGEAGVEGVVHGVGLPGEAPHGAAAGGWGGEGEWRDGTGDGGDEGTGNVFA